jgi:hypothetical protein
MSKRNEGEARVASAHVRRLVAAGVRPGDIAVITPYNAQVCTGALYRNRFFHQFFNVLRADADL